MKLLISQSKKYGPFYKIWIFIFAFISISDPDYVMVMQIH